MGLVRKELSLSLKTTGLMLLIYILAWYLPNYKSYNYMMVHQSGVFFISGDSLSFLNYNLKSFILSGSSAGISILFLVFLLVAIVLIRRSPSGFFRVLFPPLLIWNLIEMHKLIMVYLPTRYQVSLLVSLGAMAALVISELLTNQYSIRPGYRRIWKILFIFIVISMGTFNIIDLHDAYKDRKYEIATANRYLDEYLDRDDLAIGAWAPSLTWKSNSRAFPVWYGFLNYENPVERYRPAVIISEPDEVDSEEAYIKQNIDLAGISDSVKVFHIGSWQVGVFWINATP
jgi:hypothetical protein